MRRWLAMVALGSATAVVLTGCGRPAGVDGDITDDWRPVAEAQPFVPRSGVCLPSRYAEMSYLANYHPVDCAGPHDTETVFVGAFTGADADRPTVPPAGSPARRAAYAQCDRQARAYLGGDWRSARLWLGMSVTNPSAWSAGARYFRCDVSEVNSVENVTDFLTRKGSLRGALSASSPLRLGCYTVKPAEGDEVGQMDPVACTRPHQAEYVGVFVAPDVPYPTGDERRDMFLNGCGRALAAFAKVPNDGDIRFRSGLIWLPAEEEQWRAGDRGVRCYLWMDDRDLKRSMRNAGPAGLPVN